MRVWLQSLKAGAVWIPASLLAGIVIGGHGPRQDLARAKAELDLAQSQAARRESRLGTLTRIIPVPPPPATEDAALPVNARDIAPDLSDDPVPMAEDPPDTAAADTLAAQLEAARDLWELRVDIARQTFLNRALLDAADTAQFDVLMAAMNVRIRSQFETLADTIETRGDITAEEATRMLHEVSGALLLTYGEMDRVLPATWRENADMELDLFDFIDPSVAEPLLRVEGALAERRDQRPPRRRRW